MEENINTLHENIEELYKQNKFEEIIAFLTDEVLEKEKEKDKEKAAELYIWRGNSWYNIKKYDEAITDYNKAIEIIPKNEFAFYNRGLAWFVKKEYDKAIADYNIIIKLDSDYADVYYNERGIAWKVKKEYNNAISDYTKAIEINPDFANAYYNRGLAKKENNVDPEEIKKEFKKYLELTIDENELWTKYAKSYIEELTEKINDPDLWSIRQLVNAIKDKLLITEDCVHYTSFSVLRKLIIEESKFRISEGNFMNDPSEGKEFFNYLKYKPYTSCNASSFSESFSPKPFIGSFVTKEKHNDLNMWRFYGKEEGVEAKGCAITLRTEEFIVNINNFLTKEQKEARQGDESDINFYRVVYLENGTNFSIPGSEENEEALQGLIKELKKNVDTYKGDNNTCLEKYLNNIAFLFKSDAYKNENEVRLVMKGIEYKKKYCKANEEDKFINPPRVYIELEPIKKIVSQITLGPKVDKVTEWASVFHYSYEKKAPAIMISHLPYK